MNRLEALKKDLKEAQIDAAWAQQSHDIDGHFNALTRVKLIEEEIAAYSGTDAHDEH